MMRRQARAAASRGNPGVHALLCSPLRLRPQAARVATPSLPPPLPPPTRHTRQQRRCVHAAAPSSASTDAEDAAPPSALPAWLATFLADTGCTLSAPEAYRFPGWSPRAADADVRARLARGDPGYRYRRVTGAGAAGLAYHFAAPADSPYDAVPTEGTALWHDAERAPDEPKLLLQLAPQFPPLLWIPVRPTAASVAAVRAAFARNDEAFAENAALTLERYLEAGSGAAARDEAAVEARVALGPGAAALAVVDADADGPVAAAALTPVSAAYALGAVTPYAERGDALDLHWRAAGRLAAVAQPREHEGSAWYHLGTTPSPEDVEARMIGNPFVYGRWPSAVVGGEQRRSARENTVLCSTFRTLFSKSSITFTTREDEPHVSVNVEAEKKEGGGGHEYAEHAALYCHVDYPKSTLMSGGRQVVERYNRAFGCDYPLDLPVDVLAALALFAPKAVTQVSDEYGVAAGTFLDLTKDAALEVAKRQREHLSEKERAYVDTLATATRNADPVVADDASHPAVTALGHYIRRLAVMRYPEFEERCFKPFWSSDSKYIRVKVHEACLLAGRADLAQVMLARESDPYVVNQICDVSSRDVSNPG